jgi:hypothetical protein
LSYLPNKRKGKKQMQQITEEIYQQALLEPVWTTAPGIQERTGVPLSIIHVTLREAEEASETWVKREKAENQVSFLININSPQYRAIEERWRTEQMTNRAISERSIELHHLVGQWTAFGHQLAELGLIIYRNSIESEQDWRWAWNNNNEIGYPNATAAILAALQYQLLYGEPLVGRVSPPVGLLWIQVLARTSVWLVQLGKRFWKWLRD